MAEAPTNWAEFLKTFQLWWDECTSVLDVVMGPGDEVDRGESFNDRIRYIVEWCYDRTNVDPAPLWVLHRLVDSLSLKRREMGTKPAEPQQIDDQIERCSILADYLFHKAMRESAADGSDRTMIAGASASNLFIGKLPRRTDVKDLIILIDASKGDGRSKNEIAREFTSGNESLAQSLLAERRRLISDNRLRP